MVKGISESPSPPPAQSPTLESPSPVPVTELKTKGLWERFLGLFDRSAAPVPETKSFWGRFSYSSSERGATRRLREKIETARVAKLHEALFLGLQGAEKGKKKSQGSIRHIKNAQIEGLVAELNRESGIDSKRFVHRVLLLRNQIHYLHKMKKTGTRPDQLYSEFDSVEKIRAYLSKLLDDPVYRALKDKDLALINFLQILSIKLYRADVSRELREYADDLELSSKTGIKGLCHSVQTRLKKFWAHHRDTIFGKLAWALPRLLGEVWHSWESERKPLQYNSHEKNPSFVGHTFERDGKKAQFVWGPGMTGDSIVELGLLPAYQKFNQYEIRFNHQDVKKNHEFERIQKGFEISDASNGHLIHVILGFETKAEALAHKEIGSANAFLTEYKALLSDFRKPPTKEGSGVYIKEKDLSDERFNQILKLAPQILTAMGMDEKLAGADKKEKELLVQQMCWVMDSMIQSVIVWDKLDSLTLPDDPDLDEDLKILIVTSACKQGIDRGPVQANGMRLFFHALKSGELLTDDEYREIGATMVGRALVAEERNILEEKYQVFHTAVDNLENPEETLHAAMSQLA